MEPWTTYIFQWGETMTKLRCVVRMVVDSILPHAEFGQNDHRRDAPPFRLNNYSFGNYLKHLARGGRADSISVYMTHVASEKSGQLVFKDSKKKFEKVQYFHNNTNNP